MSGAESAHHPTTGAGLPSAQRIRVLWIGGVVPNTLKGGCSNRDLELCPIAAQDVEREAPSARALILEYRPNSDFPVWATPLVALALRHGLAVAITKPPEADTALYETETASLTKGGGSVVIVHGNYESTAQLARMHDPGPGASTTVCLQGDTPEDEEALTLLRRALFDFSVVRLERLRSGKSGARVWLVQPGNEDAVKRSQPWLMKFHDRVSIDIEQSNLIGPVQNGVHWQHRPSLSTPRCVASGTHALLVQDFIERAQPFRQVLRTHVPDALIGALFGHTLRGWTRSTWTVTRPIAPEFERVGILRWTDGLAEAARLAQASGCLPMDVIKQRIAGWPAVLHRQSTIHGDLHADNLFVDGPASVCVIDFANVTNGPAVTDPACLEVSLLFGAPGPPSPAGERLVGRGGEVGKEWMRSIYRYPLSPAAVPALMPSVDQGRSDAVRAIRGEARKLEEDPLPYACAVVCSLLRVASFDDNPLEDRAFAVALAAQLTSDLESEITRRTDTQPAGG